MHSNIWSIVVPANFETEGIELVRWKSREASDFRCNEPAQNSSRLSMAKIARWTNGRLKPRTFLSCFYILENIFRSAKRWGCSPKWRIISSRVDTLNDSYTFRRSSFLLHQLFTLPRVYFCGYKYRPARNRWTSLSIQKQLINVAPITATFLARLGLVLNANRRYPRPLLPSTITRAD